MGCSIINHPAFLGYPHFWKPPDVAYQKFSKLAVWFLHSWKLLHLPILVDPLSFRSRTFSSSRPPGCTSSWTRTMCHGEGSTWKSVRSQRFVFPKIHHVFRRTGFGHQVFWLVVWHMIFSHSVGNVIIPTDFHSIIFQRDRSTTNQLYK